MAIASELPESLAAGPCPPPAALARFRGGELGGAEFEAVAEHVGRCPRCCDALSNLSDVFDEPLRREELRRRESSPAGLGSEYARMEALACRLDDTDPNSDLSGDTRRLIGQYQLLSYLGRGGMGKVYRALHLKLKRQVALKCLPDSFRRDTERKARFLREMEAIGQLEHENIVRATDAGEHEGTLFLVMELVRGIDLRELLAARGPLEVADACQIARLVATALEYLELRKIVHRDVKPANVMLSFEGQVKLLDLGLARFSLDSTAHSAMTSTGQVVGTADYIAPEQVHGEDDIGPPADVYSLGCTLFQMLTGLPVFHGKKYESTMQKLKGHSDDPPPKPQALRPGIPEELSRFVGDLLTKDPAARPRPGAVVERLAPWCAGSNLGELARQGAAAAQTRWSGGDGDADAPTPSPSPPPAVAGRRHSLGRTIVNRRTALGLAGLSCSAAGLAWYKGWPPFGRHQTVPDLQTPGWQSLLHEAPVRLVWPSTSRLFDHDREREEIAFSCNGFGLLAWGAAGSDNYRARFRFAQSRWDSGLGVFFGYRTLDGAGERKAAFQVLELASFPSKDPSHSFRIERAKDTVVLGKAADVIPGSTTFTSAEIPTPKGGAHLLEFEVKSGNLVEVLWEGIRLPALTNAEANDFAKPGVARGLFGVYAYYCSATVFMVDYKVSNL